MIEFRWFQPKSPNMPPKLQYRHTRWKSYSSIPEVDLRVWESDWIDVPTVTEA